MITLEQCGLIYRAEVRYAGHYFRWDFTRETSNTACVQIGLAAYSADTPIDYLVATLLCRLIRDNVQ